MPDVLLHHMRVKFFLSSYLVSALTYGAFFFYPLGMSKQSSLTEEKYHLSQLHIWTKDHMSLTTNRFLDFIFKSKFHTLKCLTQNEGFIEM